MALNRRICTLVAVLLTIFLPVSAQVLTYEVGFETYFDNREYSVTDIATSNSGSEFASRLTPKVGLTFAEGSELKLGLAAMQPLGVGGDGLFSEINLLLYYTYDSSMWSVSAGLFPSYRMNIDCYSTAFFSDEYIFYDNSIDGIMGRYGCGDSFVEFVCDWQGQPTITTREKFKLLSAGRYMWPKIYAGYNLSVTHFAGQADGGEFSNVVDNALLNPCVGFRTSGLYDFDIKMSLLQSLQRDRSYGNKWLAPRMGEFALKISRWGFTFDERLYIGDDLFPLYDGHTLDDGTYMEYGGQLYTGDIFFRTTSGFYNRAALCYDRSFFNDQLGLRVHFVTHCDGGGLGTEQIMELNLKIGGVFYNSDKHK
ncbi:MAG: hypothetical protein SNF73_08435 [Rikenellaceae bacterium]